MKTADTHWRLRLDRYVRLTRIDRPIGWLLVLWPTLWALWLAADGLPPLKLLVIFVLGAILMRSAGCVINDYADRHIDRHVQRTRERPLTTGEVTVREVWGLFIGLCFTAFVLVLFTNRLTILLSLAALGLASLYPFMKRYTHLPQVVLGAAFGWAIPMAFAAVQGEVPPEAWLVFCTALVWTVVYDTFYAMVDREDDLQIGVKSTAVLFGDQDRLFTGTLQAVVVVGLLMMGSRFSLNAFYTASVVLTALLFCYQQYLIRYRQRGPCFAAFLNNNWVGMIIFVGIALATLTTPS